MQIKGFWILLSKKNKKNETIMLVYLTCINLILQANKNYW